MSKPAATFTWESETASVFLFEDSERQVIVIDRRKEEDPISGDAVDQLDKKWKQEFIYWLRKGRSVTRSAELAGISPRHAWRSYHEDPSLAAAWNGSTSRK